MAESRQYTLPNTQGRYVTDTTSGTSGVIYRVDGPTRVIYATYSPFNGDTSLTLTTDASQEFQDNVVSNNREYIRTINGSIRNAQGQTVNQINPDQSVQSTSVTTTNQNANGKSTSLPPLSELVYPVEARTNGQDMIRFTAVKYQATGTLNEFDTIAGRRVTGGDLGGDDIESLQGRNRKNLIGKSRVGVDVYLPIQSSITDQNGAEWGGANLNEIERFAVNTSLDLMNTSGNQFTEKLSNKMNEALTKIAEAAPQVRVALAGEAVSIQNLLSRFGQVLNPNLELLFTGPTLRPFNFTFKMSPRSEDEGKEVKQIINFFKKNMAPKGKVGKIFLESPNTFLIQYISRDKNGNIIDPHPSMNLIKECALTNCSVDYTPMGTYMTYEDNARTMVSYSMTLSFQELEPIYDADYNDSTNIQY